MHNTLKTGFARVDITPPLGTPLIGYYNVVERLADRILDRLDVNVLAFSDGENRAVLLSADLLFIQQTQMDEARCAVAAATGLPVDSVIIACTHTHNGPMTQRSDANEHRVRGNAYIDWLHQRFCEAAVAALEDLKPSKMGYGIGQVKNIAFIRRYLMKNGSIRTNPDNYEADVVAPVGEMDERVNVLRFIREGGKEIALANFGVHACTMNINNNISADFPRFVRETVEAVMPVHCIFVTGAQGDVNHTDYKRNRRLEDPYVKAHDGVDQGYNDTIRINAKHMGRAIAGALLQVYGDVDWVDVDKVATLCTQCTVPTNKAKPEELPWAREVVALHNAGRDSEIEHDPTRIKVGHVVAKACRMVNLENGPDEVSIPVCALRVGPAVFVGIAGEPFNGIGLALKEDSPYTITLPLCCTNGYEGYYPMQECYDQGGYEAGSSPFAPGVAEKLIETGKTLMNSLLQ